VTRLKHELTERNEVKAAEMGTTRPLAGCSRIDKIKGSSEIREKIKILM
jgi:hypothetical protein